MKRLIAIVLSMALVVGLLAGCSGTASTSSASASTSASASVSAKPVDISMWVFPLFDGYENIMQVQFPATIKAKYPNITLTTEVLSWDSGPEKLTVAMATGATPDMMNDGLPRLAAGIGANLCVDMTDVVNDLKGLLLTPEKEGIVNGKNYYIADSTTNGYNMTLNATLAKQLGVYDLLPADKIHWSYAQFLTFCRAARAAGKASGVYATQLWAGTRSSDAAYYSYLMTGGTKITDLKKVTANTPQAEASLAVLKTLIDEKLVPDGAATTKDVDTDPNFDSGKLVLRFMSGGAQTNILIHDKAAAGTIKGFDTEIIQYPSPTGTTDPYVASWGTQGTVIFKNANDPDKIAAAKNAIEVYFNTPSIGTVVDLKGGQAPTVNNITLDYKDATLNAQVAFANEANAKWSVADFGILESWWSDFRETFYPQLQAYYTGTKTAKQALTDWETAGNAVIAKALAASK